MTIESGDTIKIPSGTTVYDYRGSRLHTDMEVIARAKRVGVKGRVDLRSNWYPLMPMGAREEFHIGLKLITGDSLEGCLPHLFVWMREISAGFGNPRTDILLKHREEIKPIFDKAHAATIAALNDDFTFLEFGGRNDRHVVRAADVEAVEAPAPKPVEVKKEPKITKRKQMVIGSKWRFSQDITIKAWIENPRIWELVAKRVSISRSPNRTVMQGNTMVVVMGGGTPNTPSEEAQIATIQKEINRLTSKEKQIQIDLYDIKANTLVEVVDKLKASDSGYGSNKETNGLLVPVDVLDGEIKSLVTGKTKLGYHRGGYGLPYKLIEDFVEAEEIPEVLEYIIRDAPTGTYFAGWETEDNGNYNRITDEPKFSSTISGAKKYKTSSAVKASIRDMTGYNSGLDDNDMEGAGYIFDGGKKKIDLPEGWEMIAFDKATREIKGDPIDLQNWYAGLMRFRVLTQKYGSAVRAVYKKAEGKGKEAILAFKSEESFEEDETIATRIKRACEGFTGALVHTGKASIAYATSFDDAMMGKMSFREDGVKVIMLDFNTLEEVVSTQ